MLCLGALLLKSHMNRLWQLEFDGEVGESLLVEAGNCLSFLETTEESDSDLCHWYKQGKWWNPGVSRTSWRKNWFERHRKTTHGCSLGDHMFFDRLGESRHPDVKNKKEELIVYNSSIICWFSPRGRGKIHIVHITVDDIRREIREENNFLELGLLGEITRHN